MMRRQHGLIIFVIYILINCLYIDQTSEILVDSIIVGILSEEGFATLLPSVFFFYCC